MEKLNIKKSANLLYQSRIKLNRIKELPNKLSPTNNKEAYLIQDELTKIYLNSNPLVSIIGKKIGCTNKEAQKQLNVNESFFGNIFSNYISSSNKKISSKNFFSPYVEPEFSFLINKDLKPSNYPFSFEDILNSIEGILPSIEIVDSRFTDWTNIGVQNLIADNAVHAYWIYGKIIKNINQFDLNNHIVSLFINSTKIETGNSKNVLGNPINSLLWLSNKLTKNNQTIKKNTYISTGTCTKAIPIKKGNKIIADFGNLGKVNFDYV